MFAPSLTPGNIRANHHFLPALNMLNVLVHNLEAFQKFWISSRTRTIFTSNKVLALVLSIKTKDAREA